MKKLAIFLVFLSFTKIGVAYAADNTLSNIRGSYFFGTSSRQGADVVNGVLALLIGPEGKPGRAGVDGKTGAPGADGKSAYEIAVEAGFKGSKEDWLGSLRGPGGPAGAPGGAGAAGAGATVETENAGANCTNGGTKITAGNGAISYVCNGTNGSGGGSGGGSIGYGAGEVSIGACTDTATIGVKAQFTGSDFVMENITVSGLKTGCAGKTFNFYYAIDTDTAKSLKNPAGAYTYGSKIKCTLKYGAPTADGKIPAAASWGTPQLTITSANSTCTTWPTAGAAFNIDKISTADYTNKIAFEITSP